MGGRCWGLLSFGKKNTCPQASNDFRSLKENVWYASCLLAGSEIRARAEGAGDLAARATVLPNSEVTFSLYNHWPYPDLAWGNYTGQCCSRADEPGGKASTDRSSGRGIACAEWESGDVPRGKEIGGG